MNTTGRERTECRLAAILAADVAGYSRLIGADGAGTLAALKAIRAGPRASRPQSPPPTPPPPAGEGRVGAGEPPALALPDKPSIAVLPFQNMSGDPEQEYFVDGMVEDIITGLSRIKWPFVIARNS